jgi:hypothetical protein
MSEEYMSPEEWQEKLQADIVALLKSSGLVPLEVVEMAVREWVAVTNEYMETSFAEWNTAIQHGAQQSMSITYDAGGVWHWIHTAITKAEEDSHE